jgi:hypothetical protein
MMSAELKITERFFESVDILIKADELGPILTAIVKSSQMGESNDK